MPKPDRIWPNDRIDWPGWRGKWQCLLCTQAGNDGINGFHDHYHTSHRQYEDWPSNRKERAS